MTALLTKVQGSPSRQMPGEKTNKTLIGRRLFSLALSLNNSTYGPTETNKETARIIDSELGSASKQLKAIQKEISRIAQNIVDEGGPFIKGEYLGTDY